MSTVTAQPRPPKAAPAPADARLRGESELDRVSSLLMASVLGALMVVGWLWVVYLSTQAYAARAAAPLEVIDVYGGGGGSPEGVEGETERIEVPGAEFSAAASNNEVEAADFEEPSVMLTPSATLDALSSAEVVDADIAARMDTGGAVATGKRSSKLGTGAIGRGLGPGDGGVPREQRWSIIYPKGQSIDDYARQLDALKVELATPVGNNLVYGNNFSSPTPGRRTGLPDREKRLYFAWRGQGRKESDVQLLKKAGIEVGEGAILQFYPPGIEDQLARQEAAYRGRSAAEIRVTRFQVVPRGNTYGFDVVDQQLLR